MSGLLTLADVAAKLGPEVTAKLDKGVLLDVIARYANIYEPGLIKSNEQMKKDQADAMKTAGMMEAQSKAIDVAGNVAENTLIGQ